MNDQGSRPAPWRKAEFWVWPLLLAWVGATTPLAVYLSGWWRLLAVVPFLAGGAAVGACAWKYPSFRKTLWDDLGKRVAAMILIAVVLWIPSRVGQKSTGRIVFIGPSNDAHWGSFVRGFDAAIRKCAATGRCEIDDKSGKIEGHLIFDGMRYELVYLPSETKGDTERYISDLAEEDVMIIGFVSSTEADNALRTLEAAKLNPEEWPSVILPMATSSRLVDRYNPDGARPILRLVPSNSIQAEEMVNWLADGHSSPLGSVAVFRDSSNEVYSADLAKEFRSRAEAKRLAVVFDGSIGSDGPGAYVTDSVAFLRPQCVVFFGMLDTAIPLARQLRIMQQNVRPAVAGSALSEDWRPQVVFADGSVNSDVSSYTALKELDGVVGMFPHGAPADHWKQHMANGGTGARPPGPSFELFGHDTAVIVCRVLSTVRHVDRKAVRNALMEFRRDHQKQDAFRPTKLDEITAVGSYRFNVKGDVVDLRYHTWKLTPSGWAHVELDGENNKGAASSAVAGPDKP